SRVGTKGVLEAPFELGVLSCTKPGQEVCGGGWTAIQRGAELRLLVTDGLGHGPGAAEASLEATRSFRDHAGPPPAELIDGMHVAERTARRAAVALAFIDAAAGEVRFAGVGTVAGVVLDGLGRRSAVSQNGIVGHEMRRVQESTYPMPAGALLVL